MDAKAKDLAMFGEGRPDPEVSEKARRRTFSAACKRRVLEKVDQCTEPGEIGSLCCAGKACTPYPGRTHR